MFKSLRAMLASFRTTTMPATRQNPRRFAPQVEALHDRVTPTVYVSGGDLYIDGTPGPDVVSVVNTGSSYAVSELRTDAYLPRTRVTNIPVASVTGEVVFHGFDGNDSFANSTALRGVIYGGNGNDTLTGGSDKDWIFGDAGNDSLDGGLGADTMYGGDGNDQISAGGGVDDNYLSGGDGNDHLYGSDGNDHLVGDAGADFLAGNAGFDWLEGGTGRDSLYGGAGSDELDGGVGDGEYDYLHGGSGSDRFHLDPVKVGGFLWWFDLIDNRDTPADFNPTEDGIIRR